MIQTRPLRLEVKLLKTGPVGILDIFATFLQMVLTKLWCWNSIVMNLIDRYLLDWNGTELSSTPKIHRYISFTAKIYFLWKWSHWNSFFVLVMWEKMPNVNLEKFDKAMYHLQDLLIQAHENYTYRYIVCVNKKELYCFIKSFLE